MKSALFAAKAIAGDSVSESNLAVRPIFAMLRGLTSFRDFVRRERRVCLILASVAAVLVVYLVFGPKPWVSGVEPHQAAGERIRPEHYVVSAMWWAVLINLGLAALVFLAGPWLFRKLPVDMPQTPSVELDKRGRGLLIAGLIVAATLSGVMQAPRLSLSLWGDEEFTAKRFVAGYYRRDSEGAMEHKMPGWVNTVWDFRSGANNHQLFSVISRLSHSFHEPSEQPDQRYFSETLIRLPSFLASLGTIFAVGWLVALFGAPRGAMVTAFFLALHPWFLRYGPEARGYALMMLLLCLSLIFLYKAAIAGTWRYWLAFAAAEFLCFVSYMGSVQFILMLNLSGLLLVLFGQREQAARIPQLGRFVVANLLAAGLVILTVAPSIAPLRLWYENKVKGGVWGQAPDAAWIQDALCYLVSGMPWKSWDVTNPLSVHLEALPRLLTFSLLALVAVAMVGGILRLWWEPRRGRLLLPALLLPGPLMVIQARVMDNFLFPWYLLVSLPMVVVFSGLGIDWVAGRMRSLPRRTSLVAALALACFGLLLAATHERIGLLRGQSVEPLAESVSLTRQVTNPAHPAIGDGVITVGFSMWTEGYDPAATFVYSAEELSDALDQARSEGKALYVNFGQLLLAREQMPEIMAMIDDEALFERVDVLYGMWQPCTRWVYRAKL